MWTRLLRSLKSLELEERILNTGAIVALAGLFFPWISGEWLGADRVNFSGLQFYTAVLGIIVLLINLFILAVVALPLIGGPALVRKRHKNLVRLIASTQSTVLVLAALTVLINVTFEFSRMEVRYGIYISLIGSIVTTLYAFLRYQEQRRTEEQEELFRHPEDTSPVNERQETYAAPPPPPPPPPLEPEEHHFHAR